MSTSDYALIVSIFSATVALAGFGWNVWSKFIYPKARVKVTFYTCCIMNLGPAPPWPEFLCLSATNFGPTDVTLQNVRIAISGGRFKRTRNAVVNPIPNLYQPEVGVGPFGGGLPKKLAVGEEHSAYFPHTAQSFGRDDLVHVVFLDNFNRVHRAPKRQIRKVRAELDEAYAGEPFVGTLPAAPV